MRPYLAVGLMPIIDSNTSLIGDEAMTVSQSQLITALQNPALYDHTIEGFQVIETHISWVILTGPFAYKIKKAVNLGFLDFSTLAKRHHYCQEELRLNRRLAPALYLDVIAISGTVSSPNLSGRGPVIEYAVKMVQFQPTTQLDRLVSDNKIDHTLIQQLAIQVADFHGKTETAPTASNYGRPDVVRAPVLENISRLKEILVDTAALGLLTRLQEWETSTFTEIKQQLVKRKNGGFIRECHGDMHLGNMVIHNNGVTIFDCIEFNENLRWIDVMSEIAFLVMDLDDRNQRERGHLFLNHYLELSGDYQSMAVFSYYLVYRALVRAKVAAIRSTQSDLSEDKRDFIYQQCFDYLRLAGLYTKMAPPVLIITHGLSGSGKTILSEQLAAVLGLIRVRSDIERKRLYGLEPGSSSATGIDAGIYSIAASQRTYHYLADLSKQLIEAKNSVIIDAAFLKHWQRDIFYKLAAKLGISFIIIDLNTDGALLEKRILARLHTGTDASDAGISILKHQQKTQDKLTGKEKHYVLSINTVEEVDIARVIILIKDIIKNQLVSEKLPA